MSVASPGEGSVYRIRPDSRLEWAICEECDEVIWRLEGEDWAHVDTEEAECAVEEEPEDPAEEAAGDAEEGDLTEDGAAAARRRRAARRARVAAEVEDYRLGRVRYWEEKRAAGA